MQSRMFSTKFSTSDSLTYLSGQLVADVAAKHKMKCTVVGETRHTANIIFVIEHAN